jgi:hypothetical protein
VLDLVGALVDRASIDWHALSTRLRTHADARVVEHLRTIHTIRQASAPAETASTHRVAARFARVIALIAAIHTALGLGTILYVSMLGTAPGMKPTTVMLAIAFAAAGLLLASRASNDPRCAFLLATFFCVASTFARGALREVPSGELVALLRSVQFKVFIPACAWQLAMDFPRVHRFTRFDIWARRIAVTAWISAALAIVVPLDGNVSLDGSMVWHVITVSTLPAVVAIFVRSRRAPYPERRKIARFALALVVGGLPFLIHGLMRTIAPAFDAWLLVAHQRERLWLDVLVIGGLMASPILSTTALLVDRPFELRATLWRLKRQRSLSARRLARAVERMTAACGARETAFMLEREMRSGIGATRAWVMTPALDGTFVDPSGHLSPIGIDTGLHAMVETGTATINVSTTGSLFELLPTADRSWLTSHEVDLVAPLRRRNGDLIALLAVGPQRGGEPYASDDQEFVTALAAAAGLAWDADRRHQDTPHAQPAYECERCGLLHDAADDSHFDKLRARCTCSGDLGLASLPRRLNAKFIVDRRLGRGGAGVVYLARDMTIGRDVALKTLPTLRRGIGTRLAEEAQTMASLRHPGLAIIYGLEVWRQMPILVVEYFPAGTLAQRLATGPLTTSETIQFGLTLADTLSYLHGRGLLHRDIKPSNIALSATGQPVLLDFGLAVWVEPGMDRGAVAGTPGYLPPEAVQRAPATPAFDLWALAVVLRECLSGPQRSADQERRDPASPVTSILERALDRDVTRRFRTAADFRRALEAAH